MFNAHVQGTDQSTDRTRADPEHHPSSADRDGFPGRRQDHAREPHPQGRPRQAHRRHRERVRRRLHRRRPRRREHQGEGEHHHHDHAAEAKLEELSDDELLELQEAIQAELMIIINDFDVLVSQK